jgi:hypothetical protein
LTGWAASVISPGGFIVDNYMPVVEKIHAEVEAIEDTVLATTLSQPDIERLYMLRRDLLRLRNAAGPLVEVCNRLEHTELMPIDREMQPHFRDVTDHVRRVSEEIDALREVLAFAFEASLMAGQAQQTVITRRLAAWAAILAVPTAIAGIYGMNFEHMPELKWAYGYFLVIGVIIAICATLLCAIPPQRLALAGCACRQAHRKHRTLARFACHRHVAAHHARELAREGKAEPRAAVAARGQGLRLGEFLEQSRLLFGGQPDAGIRDCKLDPVASVIGALRNPE